MHYKKNSIDANKYILETFSCVIVAEIGINHNGNMELAKQCIRAAKESGADAVKFQNYRTDDFISDRSLTYTYMSQGKKVTEAQYDMFKRYELTRAQLQELVTCCREEGILFSSTPTNIGGVQDLIEAGASFIKNGSDYLTNLPLIEAMARSGLPIVLATGMATLAEIDDAVRCFRTAGGKNLTLLQCTSSYPTPPEDVHLRKIPVLRDAFGCPTGLSDHTEGAIAAIGAAALGAVMIEKHFTLDKSLPGPDHHFSANPEELAFIVRAVRTLERQLGHSAIGPTASEEKGRTAFRLSCVAASDLPAGHVLTLDDIAFRRPGTGLPPKIANMLVGLQLNKATVRGTEFSLGR